MTDSPLRSPAPTPVSLLAAGRRTVQTVYGAAKARGTITFAVNFEAGDTVTINGVVFTAMAEDAAGAQFDIGVSLSASLDALVVVLNASADALVTPATYAKSGTTILTVVHDTLSEVGNSFTLAASEGTVSGALLTGGAGGDVIDIVRNSVIEMVAMDPHAAFALGAGQEGQLVTLYFKTRNNSGNAVVTSVFTGGTTLTFDAVKERALLQYLGGEWLPLVNTATLA